ncbi:hypothetical protein ABPG74_003976 [Tetrahymena malaccensis]
MLNQFQQSKFLQIFCRILFIKGSQEQVKSVQPQIDYFKYSNNPIFNTKVIKIQFKLAFIMNTCYIYAMYVLLKSTVQFEFFFLLNYLWLLVMSIMNIFLIIPKIILTVMFNLAVQNSQNIDNLIENVVFFHQTKIYILNNRFSRYIIAGYCLGFFHFLINLWMNTDNSSDELQMVINALLIIFIARIFFSIYIDLKREKGLSPQQTQIMVTNQSYLLTQTELEQINDCCSICIEDFQLNQSILKLECQHIFHTPCIEKWFPIQNKCPNCNQYMVRQL